MGEQRPGHEQAATRRVRVQQTEVRLAPPQRGVGEPQRDYADGDAADDHERVSVVERRQQ